ncbi:hypothetical protein LPJ68_005391 [Coemansia sp. RSA 1086]|nr:hypothetical protein LPJ68_005391 [Coemansia sp. RSA 1086]
MRLHKLWTVLLSLGYGVNAQELEDSLPTDMGFEQAPYIIYPDGIAHKETSMPESSPPEESSSYPDEPEHELGELEVDVTTVSMLYVTTVPVTVYLPMETDVELSTELDTEVTTEYYTLYSDMSIAPITVTATASSDIELTQSGSIISSTPNPTTLQPPTFTLATTEHITSSVTELAQVNSDVNVQTVTTTLPPTITLAASTTTVLLTATNTMEVTATQSTQIACCATIASAEPDLPEGFIWASDSSLPSGLADKETSMSEPSSKTDELGDLDEDESSPMPDDSTSWIVVTSYSFSVDVEYITETPVATTVESVVLSVIQETETETVVVTSMSDTPIVTETVTLVNTQTSQLPDSTFTGLTSTVTPSSALVTSTATELVTTTIVPPGSNIVATSTTTVTEYEDPTTPDVVTVTSTVFLSLTISDLITQTGAGDTVTAETTESFTVTETETEYNTVTSYDVETITSRPTTTITERIYQHVTITSTVAGSPQVVVLDEGNNDELYAWEKNEQYASESPWPGNTVSSVFSMAPSLNYPVGMADKETSMPGSSETTLFEVTELPDGNLEESGNLVETETVFITLSPDESNNVEESPAGPVTVTEKLEQSQDVVIVTPIIQVNLSQLGDEVQTVTNTVMSTISSEPTPSVLTVTETLGQPSPSVVTVTSVPPVTVTVGSSQPAGPVTVTVGESSQPAGPVTVTVGESSEPAGPVTVTVGEPSEPEGEQVTSTVIETVKQTETEKVTQTAFATVGMSAQIVGESATATQGSNWSMGGSSGQQQIGGVVNEPVQQVGHSTFVQTVATASYDIVRVIGPSYTSTISMHMQGYVNGQPFGQGTDLISPPPVTSSAASAYIQTPYSTSNTLSLPTPSMPSLPNSGAQGQVVVGGMIVGSSGSSSSGSVQYQGGSANGSSQNVQSAGTQSAFGGQQNSFDGQQNSFGGQQNGFSGQQDGFSGQQNGIAGQQNKLAVQPNGFLVR